jgi:oligopeptide transport system substrate-binding protein
LLADAGYPDGDGFPIIRLLINRNEQQRQVAQAVAASWRETLGIETEIIAKPWEEYEAAMRAGNYDLARRGAVMQSADETSNLRMLFPLEERIVNPAGSSPTATPTNGTPRNGESEKPLPAPIETEAEALRRVTAIPIYFAASYSLVKPYVKGFDSNVLDAPSLKTVNIDTSWKAPR